MAATNPLARLHETARNLQNKRVARERSVLQAPRRFRHTLTGGGPLGTGFSLAHIQRQGETAPGGRRGRGALRISTGIKAHYGDGLYVWEAGTARVGTWIDIEVPAGTLVEKLTFPGGKFWYRLLPPHGDVLKVRILDSNMPGDEIIRGRRYAGGLPNP